MPNGRHTPVDRAELDHDPPVARVGEVELYGPIRARGGSHGGSVSPWGPGWCLRDVAPFYSHPDTRPDERCTVIPRADRHPAPAQDGRGG